MTTNLRLRRDDVETEGGDEVRTLRFPAEAAAAMPAPSRSRDFGRGGNSSAVAGRVAPSIRRDRAGGDDEALDLVRQIEQTLDSVQSRFDDLRQQLTPAYRIRPERDDWQGPSAA